MKNLNEFVQQLVKIEFLSHCNAFGFYPFQMFVEDKEGKATICTLELGGEIGDVYKVFAQYFNEGAKRIYVAVDFPATGDIEKDFVCILGYSNDRFIIYAIPYNVETGETLPEIKESQTLTGILNDLSHFLTVKA